MSNGIAALASSAVLLAATALWVTFAQKLAKVSEATTTTTGSSFNKETSKLETATEKCLKQQHANAKPGPLSDFLPCKVTAVNRWKAR